MLRSFTIAVNFLSLAFAVWLGIYIITRNQRSLIAWLTGLTLGALGGVFLNILLALNPPPTTNISIWLRIFFPFWGVVASENPNSWLQGWSVAPAIAFWHHMTTLLRPGILGRWRWTRIIGVYLIAGSAAYLQVIAPIFPAEAGDPLYINTIQAGPLYPFYAIALLIILGYIISNLLRTARAATFPIIRNQLYVLTGASVLAGLVGPILILGTLTPLEIPMVAISLPLGIAVGLIGYGVARYSALMAGRTHRRDFIYNFVAVFITAMVYYLAGALLVQLYELPIIITQLVVVLAIVTHAMVSVARGWLNRLFFGGPAQDLRSSFVHLSQLADEQGEWRHDLGAAFAGLCESVRATFGLILRREADTYKTLVTYRWGEALQEFHAPSLDRDDATSINPGDLPDPLGNATLLLPLYNEEVQIGVIVLGNPENGVHYSSMDIESILYPTDRITDTIVAHRREREHLNKIAELSRTLPRRSKPLAAQNQKMYKLVENALRNLDDFTVLGDSELANLTIVRSRLKDPLVTFVDRGREVYAVLVELLEKLKPEGKPSTDPPEKKWHPYLILTDAYLNDVPNKFIMGKLYISEGNFNRTRRSAIRALARLVEETEASFTG